MPNPPIREGFPGQHHVVVPPAVARRAAKHALLRGLLPTDAGLYPRAAGHFVERERGAAGHVVIVCVAGRGFVRWRGRTSEVAAGGVVVLPPGEAHAYGADEGDPWTIEWAHFGGDEAAAWREAILGRGAAEPVVPLDATRAATLGLARVHERLEAGYHFPQLLGAAAALRAALGEIVARRMHPENPPTLVEAVEASAAWARERLARKLTLGELAARARLSPSHFSAVFRKRFGFAPIDWLIRQRIREACRLLDGTADKIEAVGAAVGFEDPYYFSRAFRKVMGVAPREYRRTVKG